MADVQQSPVNLTAAAAYPADVPPDYLRTAWATANGHEHQGAHGIEVTFRADPAVGLTLRGKWYTLRSYHFHVPSEHWLEGRQAAGEVHIVHQNPDDGTLAVLGVLLKVSTDSAATAKTDAFLKELKQYRASVATKQADQRKSPLPTNPTDFLPPADGGQLRRAYRYVGSLTTAPYSEPVAWLVFQTPTPVSAELLAYLDPAGPGGPQEARAVQPLNGRLVLDIAVDPLAEQSSGQTGAA